MQQQNVVRLASHRRSVLNPGAILYIINAGHGGFDLSEFGKRQSEQLGNNLKHAGLRRFELVILPRDSLVKQTAERVLAYHGKTPWLEYAGCEFISPRNEATARALRDLVGIAKENRSISWPQKEGWSATLYGRCIYELRDTSNNFLEGFKDEIRRDIRAIPHIAEVLSLAIFSRELIGNVVAGALFPQHRNDIENIELCSCSILRLSADGCKHFPLLY